MSEDGFLSLVPHALHPPVRRWARVLGVLAAATALVVAAAPATEALTSPPGELVIIDSVKVGSPILSTQSSCNAFSGGGRGVVPVTIVATFITPPDREPVGPYATSVWSGGYGSSDDHFGTGQAKSTTQTFHINMPMFGHLGPGQYTASVIVQDVGMAGGFAERDRIPVNITGPPPLRATSRVKCSPVKPFDLAGLLKKMALKAAQELLKQSCGPCVTIYKVIKGATIYSPVLDYMMGRTAADDPPDANYQQIAQPNAPPILPAPPEATSEQQAALLAVENGEATAIGVMRALYTSLNRVWGADNAADKYWHQRQLKAVSTYASKAATAFAALPKLYGDLQASLAAQLPTFTITARDVAAYEATIVNGFPPADAALFEQLGVGPEAQQDIADNLLAADAADLPPTDGATALFGQNFAEYVDPMRQLAAWAGTTPAYDSPVVTSVNPNRIPTGGGTDITITGTHLETVTGIEFGPSTPTSGQPATFWCTDTMCGATAPPGAGTVDVVLVGPGGPSAKVTADRLTYFVPAAPTITNVFPDTGPLSGNTLVTVLGTGLAGARLYFGPTIGFDSQCTGDAMCQVRSPGSASTSTVDVTAVTDGGTSATSTADLFSYVTSVPPPSVPIVTGVSPNHGAHLGGDTVTITGSNFTGVSVVEFGTSNAASFVVLDDSHIRAVTGIGNAGAVDVVVGNSAGTSAVTGADTFTYEAPAPPTVTGVSPNSGPDIGGTRVTITGTRFAGENTTVRFGDGWVGDSICTSTGCTATAPPGADGPVDVTVQTADGTSSPTPADVFTYLPGPTPAVTAITPDIGTVSGGTSLAVFGDNLNGGVVKIGGIADPDSECTPEACVASTPAHAAGTVHVTVTTQAGTSAGKATDVFSYVKLPAPVIKSVVRNWGWLDGFDDVQISGEDLTDATIKFGAKPAMVDLCTQGMCLVSTPSTTTVGPVHVTATATSGTSATSSADLFTYVQPVVTGVSPARGWSSGLNEVTVTGSHFLDPDTSVDPQVWFGTYGSPHVTCTETECVAEAPGQAAGTVDLRVQPKFTKSPITAADEYTYADQPKPVVTGVTPNGGTHDGFDAVTVTGTNLDGGRVLFGTQVAAPNPATAKCTTTKCTVVSPVHPTDGPVNVTVQTPRGTSAVTSAGVFTYHAPGLPVVTGVSPGTGSTVGGPTITIVGSRLTNGRPYFGTQVASGVAGVQSCYATKCTVPLPAHAAGTVHVTVKTTGGTSATSTADQFTYAVPSPPTVTGVTPNWGPASGGSQFTVTGTNLRGATLNFDTTAATNVTCTATSCTGLQPPGEPGVVHVTATTPGGTSAQVAADRFTYSTVTLTEHAVPGITAAYAGGAIARGLGGDMWFTMPTLDKIGRIAPGGTIATYATPNTKAQPLGITDGPDGRMWYSEQTAGAIVAIDAAGNQELHQLPGMPSDLRFITTGPDGRLWFTLVESDVVGAMTTSGDITLYRVPDLTGPYQIVPGADGRLWFTEVKGNGIGAITTDGQFTQYPIPDMAAMGWGISRGPDKRIWFVLEASHKIGAISTTGVVTMYPLPASNPNPEGITYGGDGKMWFASPDLDQVSSFDPVTRTIKDFALPGGGSLKEQPRYLTGDADGTLWVTEFGSKNVASVSGIIAPSTVPKVLDVTSDHGAAGDVVTITGVALGGASAVTFGSVPATSYDVADPGRVTATVPVGTGTVAVEVTTPNGTSAGGPTFTYGSAGPPQAPELTSVSPAWGGTGGGTAVTIAGYYLSGAQVTFGGVAATGVNCTATSCVATSPAHSVGTVDVRLTTAGGTTAVVAAGQFTYRSPPPPTPQVTGLNPASGTAAGGTVVTITGSNLTGGTIVFGANPATAVTCAATACAATSPRGTVGFVDVRVTTEGGTSARTAADRFTYQAPAPSNLTRPAITGTARLGNTLTCSSGTWQWSPTGYTYRWYRDGAAISGASASTHTVVSADLQRKLTCAVTATNAAGSSAPALSAPVTVQATTVLSAQETTKAGAVRSCGGTAGTACQNVKGTTVYFAGKATPIPIPVASRSVTVRFYYYAAGAWQLKATITVGTASSSGAWHVAMTSVTGLRGAWRVRATASATTALTAGTSTYRYYDVP